MSPVLGVEVWRPGSGATIALGAVAGLLIGSFLNVVIVRVPAGRSVVTGASVCPQCGNSLAARDLVPVLSWLLLRGQCRRCRRPIPWRYPAVEALTAGLFALVAWRVGLHADLPAHLVAAGGMVALSGIDIEHHRLPNRVLYPTGLATAAGLVVAALGAERGDDLVRAGAGAAIGFGALLLIHLVRPDAMGFGDVRLAGLCGLLLGWHGWAELVLGLYAGFVLGAVVGVALIAARRATRGNPIPFGPFLTAGTWLVVLAW